MKNFICLIFLVLLIFSTKNLVFADSSYVLPYPDSMPESRFYKLNLIWEKVSKYWYFGDFGQFYYNLKYSDKYLVESKTLFEYNQYLLALSSLRKSDSYFLNILPSIQRAKKASKDVSEEIIILKKAASKHIEVLEKVTKETPEVFNWQMEKSEVKVLYLRKSQEQSIAVREKIL